MRSGSDMQSYVALLLASGVLSCGSSKKEPTSERQQSSAAVAAQSASVTGQQVIPEAPPNVGFAEVSLGDAFTCARTKADQVYCWGSNEFGGLGSPDVSDQHRPRLVPLPRPAIQIGTGNYYSCALLETREVACWGSREKGNIGDGTQKGPPTGPVTLPIANVAHITVEPTVAFAFGDDGTVHTWGFSPCVQGRLRSPEPCLPLKGARIVRDDTDVGCWIRSSGETRCWGRFTGSCGSPTKAVGDALGAFVPLPDKAVELVQKFRNGCVLVQNSEVYCWGDLPFEGMGCRANAVRVPTLSGVASLALYYDTLCAVRNDGSAWCAGDNETGVLGDGTRKFRGTFAPIQGLMDVKQVDVGTHACAVTRGGKLYCWGKNDHGQLGDGTIEDRLTPVEVVLEEHKQQ